VTVAATIVTVLALGLSGAAWRAVGGTRLQQALTTAQVAVLVAAAVLVLATAPAAEWGATGSRVLLVLLGVLAVAGGGPLAVAVLSVADHAPGAGAGPDERPDNGEVLRGGAWIGSLERAGIFATLAVGWPEGVAVVLAIKGIGRYQELGQAGAAERFIIGTFASVLWASACAGIWWFGSGPL
jgi:hypothetical protein